MTAPARPVSAGRLLEPLGSRNFRRMWIGQLIALIGVQGYLIAQAWLVIHETGSTAALGTLLALVIAPRAVLLPIGGLLSDRLHPRRVLLVSVVVFAAITGVLAQSLLLGGFAMWHLRVCAVLFGVISALCLPAFFAMLPILVGQGQLQSANSLAQIAMQASQFLGPALGGLVVEAAGIGRAYGVMALAFATSAMLFAVVRTPHVVAAPVSATGARGGLGACVALFRRERRLLGLVVLTLLTNLGLAGPLQVLLPAVAHGSFQTGVDGLGLLLTAFGAGTFAGALVAGGLDQRTNRMRIALLAGAAAGIGWAVLGATGSLPAAIGVLIVVGACLGVLNVLFITQVQALTPAHLLGRVMGIQLLGSMGLQPVSFLIAGWTVDRIGMPPVFLAGGALVAGTCLALIPSWR